VAIVAASLRNGIPVAPYFAASALKGWQHSDGLRFGGAAVRLRKGIVMMRYLALAVGFMMAWDGVGVARASFIVSTKKAGFTPSFHAVATSRWRHVGTYPGGAAPKSWAGSAFVPSVWVNGTHVFTANGEAQALDAYGVATANGAAVSDLTSQSAVSAVMPSPSSVGGIGAGHALGMAWDSQFWGLGFGGSGLAGSGGVINSGGDGASTVAAHKSSSAAATNTAVPVATIALEDDDPYGAQHHATHSQLTIGQSNKGANTQIMMGNFDILSDNHPPFSMQDWADPGKSGMAPMGGVGPAASNPEPASLTLFGIGGMALAGSAWWRRGRGKQSAA